MDMDSMAVWLAGSVLFTLGIVTLVTGVIIINNLIHKYWKPITFVFVKDNGLFPHARFATEEEMTKIAPMLEDNKNVDIKRTND